MKKINISRTTALALAVAAIFAAGPILADPPSWAGGEKSKKEHKELERHNGHKGDRERDRDDHRDDRESREHRPHVTLNQYFGDQQRSAVNGYYVEQYRAGRCPPGLAKKNNGCLPPGQAKKWSVGHPLPQDVRYYELPAPVITRLGPPPIGYQYVRVDNDVLLLATGTRMVIDAIRNLGW